MAISPQTCRAAFLAFLDEWQAKLENLEADVEASDARVDIDGQDMPTRNLFFWLRRDTEILPDRCCDFLGIPKVRNLWTSCTNVKGRTCRQAQSHVCRHREKSTDAIQPVFCLAASTLPLAIEEVKSLFQGSEGDPPIFHAGEKVTILHQGKEVDEYQG